MDDHLEGCEFSLFDEIVVNDSHYYDGKQSRIVIDRYGLIYENYNNTDNNVIIKFKFCPCCGIEI